jgi:hypothetical protein
MTHEAMKEIPMMDEDCLPSGTAPRKKGRLSRRRLRYDVMNQMRRLPPRFIVNTCYADVSFIMNRDSSQCFNQYP